MAVRLPVIVSQAEARDQRSADIEESLVAELIMSGGLDATLVGPLRRIQSDSTDLLCLRGFSHHVALLTWMTIDEAQLAWQALGMDGAFVAMQSAADIANAQVRPPSRRVYYLQLRNDSDPKTLCAMLRAKLDDMRIKPVSLQLLKPNGKDTAKTSSGVEIAPTATTVMPIASVPEPTLRADLTSIQPVAAERDLNHATSEPRWEQLDQLVDDLDALDL